MNGEENNQGGIQMEEKMILCCKTCGNYFYSGESTAKCDYCGGNTEVLFTEQEVSSIDKLELDELIRISREKYKFDNAEYSEELWKSREYKESVNKKEGLKIKEMVHMLTTGYNFEGYNIVAYRKVITGQVVLGTGFLSEFAASFSDFFGVESNTFSDKMEKAKEAALDKMIKNSVEAGGNAIIGVDFDYITFAYNMIGVVASGTSVVIEKIQA